MLVVVLGVLTENNPPMDYMYEVYICTYVHSKHPTLGMVNDST